MSYTGDVKPGGPADIRRLGALTISKFSVSSMDNNVYLLRCSATGEQLLVDAADDPDRILQVVGPAGLATVVTTHRHWDHVRATADVVRRTGARSLAHEADAAEIPTPTIALSHGDPVWCGRQRLSAIHLVGHTPGSIALMYRDSNGWPHLFTGDSLFPGGPGKTRTKQDFATLMNDLEQKIFAVLPDDTWVYPGHGRDTTLGVERPHLAEWRARGW
ncbi:MAG: MBL fold metallo-hydrolase [Stackebrandtia sp.]